MKRISSAVMALTLAAAAPLAAVERVTHEMEIRLDPATHSVEITDSLALPTELTEGGPVEFVLSAALEITASEPAVERVELGEIADFFGINSSAEIGRGLELARYRLSETPADGLLTIAYGGGVHYGLSDQKEEYTRGFRETAGVLGHEGVYLAGSGSWYPRFDDGLLEFELTVEVPEGWHVISQGDGTSRGPDGRARWSSAGPMDEIYLVGGPLIEYSDAAGAVEALVYLHEPDDALAAKYLTTTAQYVELYRGLIGPYPYGKFALVENFWETGYGMPSFTLLGPQIIRFPFILHSSYPHEILHNWWGNSVFVDYPTGNWCEGLTAYLADHLVQEQRGKGAEYRLGVLQKYRSYVQQEEDFPLSEFRSRHSAATEAVGYGKTLMGFHMLRRQLGDDTFRSALARLYRGYKGRRASFGDLREVFSETSERDLVSFFSDWVERPGAPELRVQILGVESAGDGFVVKGNLHQVQEQAPFAVDVPIAVQTAAGRVDVSVAMETRSAPFEIAVDSSPRLFQVDPEFDLFRRIDPRESAPSIGQVFGGAEIVAALPSAASEERRAAYRQLMEGWQSDSHAIEIVLDSELDELPADRSLWVLGGENTLARELFGPQRVPGLAVAMGRIQMEEEKVPAKDHSLVAIRRHPDNAEAAIGWIVVEPEAAFPGMGRKLPHYGKYSYLAFQGEEPTNVVKGQWATSDSPLRADLRADDDRQGVAALDPDDRVALAEMPPVFSRKRLAEHVERLAAPELEGRGVGSEGLRKAAEYIAAEFEAAGLTPAGDDGSYLQRFTVAQGPDGTPVDAVNVIGYLPGSESGWSEQSFVLSAHYDHLGRGWPDVKEDNRGKIHPGADDNASGVAVLLELARNLAAEGGGKRSLVFAAFSAEEAGRLGSKHYVEHPTAGPLSGVRGVINLDTVGRLGDAKIQVLGTGTADEWQHIFRGVGFVTGVEGRNVPGDAEGSDQMSFIEKGIPAVQIFATAHEDYHLPGDVAAEVDTAGLVKVATFVKEATTYMTEREEPLTVRIAATSPAPAASPAPGPSSGRRVRLGTIPEFGFQGPGVKISGVTPGSPAEAAGLQEGDVLTGLDGQPIEDLRGYSQILRTLSPGQEITLTVERGGEELTVSTVLVAR